MGGIRLVDPLEQELLDHSLIEQIDVADLRAGSPAVKAQMDRLSRLADRIYVHVDMDVLDEREVMGHGNKVPGGPPSAQLADLFTEIFRDYPKTAAIGFATIPRARRGRPLACGRAPDDRGRREGAAGAARALSAAGTRISAVPRAGVADWCRRRDLIARTRRLENAVRIVIPRKSLSRRA